MSIKTEMTEHVKTKYGHSNYEALVPFLNVVNCHEDYAKFVSDGYIPLSIEKLWYEDPFGNPVYSICHWGELNGDAMRDPEITFGLDDQNEVLIPLSFENSYMAYYEEVFMKPEDEWLFSKKSLTGIDDFLHTWLDNIKEQGFTPDKFND